MVPRQGKWGRGVAHKLQQGEWGMCTRQTVGAMGEVGVVQLVQYGKVSSLSLFNFLAYVIFLSIIILTHAPPLLLSAAPPTTTPSVRAQTQNCLARSQEVLGWRCHRNLRCLAVGWQ